MKERPILFSGEMVRAILDGRKTQTRRVIKLSDGSPLDDCDIPAHEGKYMGDYIMDFSKTFPQWKQLDCPYGQSGDRLWVRETWARAPHGFVYRANYKDGHGQEVVDIPTGETLPLVWRPSIYMPRSACRISLEIINVRVEHIQEISEVDCCLETGSPLHWAGPGPEPYKRDMRLVFRLLWDSFNAKRGFGWDLNPWVWVIEFKELEPTQ